MANQTADDVFKDILDEIESTSADKNFSSSPSMSVKDNEKKYKITKQRRESIEIKWKDILFEIFFKVIIQFIILAVMYLLYVNVDFFYKMFNSYYLVHYMFYIWVILLLVETIFFFVKLLMDIDVILYKYVIVKIQEDEIVQELKKPIIVGQSQ